MEGRWDTAPNLQTTNPKLTRGKLKNIIPNPSRLERMSFGSQRNEPHRVFFRFGGFQPIRMIRCSFDRSKLSRFRKLRASCQQNANPYCRGGSQTNPSLSSHPSSDAECNRTLCRNLVLPLLIFGAQIWLFQNSEPERSRRYCSREIAFYNEDPSIRAGPI